MREWLLNLLSAIFGTFKLVVRKGEVVSIEKLNAFLSMLPSKPVAKIVDQGHHHYMVEFRIKMPRKRATRQEKREVKRGRTWAGGKMPSERKLKVVENKEGNSNVG